MDPEQDIILKFRQGDRTAVRLIFNLYHKGLYYFANKTLHDQKIAEDIVADAFIKLWQRNTAFNDLVAIKLFLYAVVSDRCLYYMELPSEKEQSHKTLPQLTEINEEYIESKMIKAELVQVLLKEIESLPPLRQKIFKMVFLDGLSIFEVAEKLHLTIDAIRVQKAKAMHTICSAVLKKEI